MSDGIEKRKTPPKFGKRAARYNEFRCKTYIKINQICDVSDVSFMNIFHL